MAPQAQSVMAVSLETGPEQLPISPRLASVEPSTAHSDRLRPLEVAQCSLCGIARPLGLLVPDGGQACADIRWYCKDSLSCTQRWTTALSAKSAYVPATPGYLVAGAEEPATDEAPAERLDELAEAQPGG
jgi:hypothetical protein